MIEFDQVAREYRMGDAVVAALRGVTLRIERGEFVAIMGPSGSGKSTLMHLLGLLDTPDAGHYRLLGHDVAEFSEDERAVVRSQIVGFVFQQFHLLPRSSALDNVAMPLLYSTGRPPARARAAELLDGLGLGARRAHRPNELSGGQQQRVAIARALINDPEIILADEPTGNLDSASAADILGILRQLHQAGKTVILVTHEPDLAADADRVIQLRDGRMVADQRRQASAAPVAPVARPPLALRRRTPLARRLRRTAGLVRQAVRTLKGNKVRAGLSMLGILIGVAAVIAMLALGAGAKQAIKQSFSSLGSNALMLFAGVPRTQGVARQIGANTMITLDDVRGMPAAVPAIARLSPMVNGRVQAICGNKNWNTSVIGAGPDYAKIRSSPPQVGRFFTVDEITQRARVAVIGTTVVRELFGQGDPIGEFIRLNRVSFQVVGVLPPKGSDRFHDQDDVIVVPVTTAMYRLLGRKYVDMITLEIGEEYDMDLAQKAIVNYMLRRHRLPLTETEAYHIHNLAEIQQMLTATSKTMSLLLSSIAVISLLVGGIGIMNIMLVSVTERTREIGLRKAVGARSREILVQFLVEAVVVSGTGGLIGILLGWGAAWAMSRFANWTVAVSTASVALAFVFSALVGVVFGLWPAQKAARLNPIEALRYE